MCLCVQIFFRKLQIKFSQHKNYPHLAKTLIASCAARRSRIKFKFRLSKFVHSADKMAEMRTKFHVIQVKLIMSVYCFTVQWHIHVYCINSGLVEISSPTEPKQHILTMFLESKIFWNPLVIHSLNHILTNRKRLRLFWSLQSFPDLLEQNTYYNTSLQDWNKSPVRTT